MLFSGSVKSYKCTKCNRNFSEVTPTSVIPMLIVIITSTVIWARNISEFFNLEAIGLLLSILFGFVLTIGILFLAFVLLQNVFSGWTKRMKCPECGGKLEITGGGFVDGGIPGLQEFLLYIIVTVLPLGAALLIS